jgi:hypothetical protein
MANLTAFAARGPLKTLWSATCKFIVENAITIPVGAYTLLPGTSGNTATRGYLDNYQDLATAIFTGYCIGASTPGDLTTANTVIGDTSATPAVAASCEIGSHILLNYAVTAGSAQSDVGKKVYLSNNNDLTMTLGNSPAVGRIIGYTSATQFDVMMYGMIGSDLLVG